ncbi:methyl-accepting chemotaxis protein [Amphibacillus sp. Q70]|uniref:methyl-accepting chemotaxis protein n=1 Tax=Amphibacillus sp. Q70 TaxID=3453416 RepID=UPI003F82ACC4
MKKTANFKKLGTRLIIGFGIIIILVISLSSINVLSIYRINNSTEAIINEDLELLTIDEQLSSNMLKRLNYLQAFALTGNVAYQNAFLDNTSESLELEQTALERSDSEHLQTVIDKKTNWGQLADQFFKLYDDGNETEALRVFEDQIMPTGMGLISDFEGMASKREAQISGLGNQITEAGQLTLNTSLYISVLVIIVGLVTAFITTRVISRPIKRLTKQMLTIASGDLSTQIEETDRRDELGQLVQATGQMATNMRKLLLEIQNVSNTVSGHSDSLTKTTSEVTEGAEQISVTMQELASGSETQTAHLNDLSTNTNEFVSTVSVAQQLGESVANESKDVRNLSVKGAGLMENSIEQMREIDSIVHDSVEKVVSLNNQSKEISNIVSVIQDIAEQTNLLALNASIEAARAGEQGKGFAVVAEEVRKLAEQVGSSVQDITQIVSGIQNESQSVKITLEDSYQQVQQGTNQIGETSKTFHNIDNAIGKMTTDIQQITDQLTNMLSVSQTLSGSAEEIASISEESAAGVEETSASAEEVTSSMGEISSNSTGLANLVEELNQLIRQFKL